MSWKIIPKFFAATTNFSKETMLRLKFGESYRLALELLQLDEHSPEFKRRFETATQTFETELQEKRTLLWDQIKDDRFLHALLELNPDFLEFIAPYASQKDLPSRNKPTRKKEMTLFSYLTRFCLKPSICGTSGTLSEVNLRQNAPTFAKSVQKNEKKKAFFSHRCAQALAQYYFDHTNIFHLFQLKLHPCVTYVRGALQTSPWFKHHGMPASGTVELSEKLRSLLSEGVIQSAWSHLPATLDSELILEIKKLVSLNFLKSKMFPPPGELEPLAYWECCAINGENSDYLAFSTHLATFKKLLTAFESDDLHTKQSSIKQADELFKEITNSESRNKNSKYYSDRLIFYVDNYNGSTITMDERRFHAYQDQLCLAYELLAPQWLWALLKDYLYIQVQIEQAQENKKVGVELLRAIFKAYGEIVTGQADYKSIQGDPRFQSWAQDIQLLITSREAIWDIVATKQNLPCVTLQNEEVETYRKTFSQVMGRHDDFPLPVYSSFSLFQWIHDSAQSKDNLVFDSAIFGNAMNMMSVNQLALDIPKQTELTKQAFAEMLKLREGIALLNVVCIDQQRTKFTPWILPGKDLEFLNLSFKSPEDVYSPATELDLSKNKPLFTNTLRLSKKLLLEDHPHTPRIEYGSAVLQRETWFFDAKEISEPLMKTQEHHFPSFFNAIKLQKQLNLPSEIWMESAPNLKNIFIDFENFLSIELLRLLIKDAGRIKICEALPNLRQEYLPERCSFFDTFIGFFYFS